MSGLRGLFYKEILRFWRVVAQTIGAPVLSSILYVVIFSHILGEKVQVYEDISYTEFLIPGLVIMSVLQNAFANTSSSLIQSKVTGNLSLILLPPISTMVFFLAYTLAATVRGVLVGAGVLLVAWLLLPSLTLKQPLFILVFACSGGVMMGALGIVAGLWAEKFDQIALFTNFIVMPLTFLSGVFYSVHSLSTLWRTISYFNPFLYLIDGFRYGFFEMGDINPYISLLIAMTTAVLVSLWAILFIRYGYKKSMDE